MSQQTEVEWKQLLQMMVGLQRENESNTGEKAGRAISITLPPPPPGSFLRSMNVWRRFMSDFRVEMAITCSTWLAGTMLKLFNVPTYQSCPHTYCIIQVRSH